MTDRKEYLGDGAYARFDGYTLWLTAENGVTATDTIGSVGRRSKPASRSTALPPPWNAAPRGP